jgi:ankyrin repeat protein
MDRGGRTPLHYAALENDVRKVEALLVGGADPNSADIQGFTPLHFAAQQWSVEAARLLLDRGAAVDPVDGHGNTPLWAAVFNSNGRGALIELLRGRGADPLRAADQPGRPNGVCPALLAPRRTHNACRQGTRWSGQPAATWRRLGRRNRRSSGRTSPRQALSWETI